MLNHPQHLIAIDIDGTLYDDNDHYNIERFNQDLAALIQANIQLIVATGNSYDAVQQIFAKSPLVDTVIAENGGRIVANGHNLVTHLHQRSILQQLLNYLKSLSIQPDLLSLSGQTNTHIAIQFKLVPVPFYPHHQYFTQLSEIQEPIYNLNINWFKKQPSLTWMLAVADHINEQFAGSVHATYSGSYGIDILPANVNKARGLKELLMNYPDLTLADVTAYGDSTNDLEMINEVGTGIAMCNANQELQRAAKAVTDLDNNHDGLLADIEQRFLK